MDSLWVHFQNLTDAQSIISIGFFFLLVVVFAETGLFFGFFLPGDYLLFMSGLLCSTGKFDISIYTLIISLIAAGVLGNYTGYWFGLRAGPSLFSKHNTIFFKKHHIIIAEEFYAKHGAMALVLGRFFPIINISGCVAWVCLFTLSGYFLGRKYPQVQDYMEYVIIGLIVVTSIPLVFALFRRKWLHSGNVNELK
jgi:membrane-associated protein